MSLLQKYKQSAKKAALSGNIEDTFRYLANLQMTTTKLGEFEIGIIILQLLLNVHQTNSSQWRSCTKQFTTSDRHRSISKCNKGINKIIRSAQQLDLVSMFDAINEVKSLLTPLEYKYILTKIDKVLLKNKLSQLAEGSQSYKRQLLNLQIRSSRKPLLSTQRTLTLNPQQKQQQVAPQQKPKKSIDIDRQTSQLHHLMIHSRVPDQIKEVLHDPEMDYKVFVRLAKQWLKNHPLNQ